MTTRHPTDPASPPPEPSAYLSGALRAAAVARARTARIRAGSPAVERAGEKRAAGGPALEPMQDVAADREGEACAAPSARPDPTGRPSGPALTAGRRSRLHGESGPAHGVASASAAPGRQSIVAPMAAEPGMHRPPSIVQGAGLPSLTLLACEAGPASPRDEGGRSRPGARPAPRADRRGGRKRLAPRLAILGFALVGGFGLGIVANGGVLLTGSKLGEAMLALAHLFDRPAEAPAARGDPQPATPPPRAAAVDGVRPANPVPVRAASGGSIAGPSESRKTAAAASTGQSPPRAAAALPPAGANGVGGSPRERGRSERTMAAAPAGPPAAASDWEALYAQGHRFQLRGNLMAAADAYRRAIRLNPHHPAMLYDLGYVLQMQGQSDAAMG
jgi:hypothetical protein